MFSHQEFERRREQHRREMQRARRIVVALWLMMAATLLAVGWFTLTHPEAIGSWIGRLSGGSR